MVANESEDLDTAHVFVRWDKVVDGMMGDDYDGVMIGDWFGAIVLKRD